MKILSIETSCDETAISIVEATGDFPNAEYMILGNSLRSQINLHREYGGVFPNLAKRDHAAIITTLLKLTTTEANLPGKPRTLSDAEKLNLAELLQREHDLAQELINYVEGEGLPDIDIISVTTGPGLEPALWVGLNFAKALSFLTKVPVVPANHMEGHIFASLFKSNHLAPVSFPAMALLISGGHTELILMPSWHQYEKVGQTRDDAVGEAFDKVARLLGLPYPGGPEINRLANEARTLNLPEFTKLPHPMLDSDNLDFSFSGLKTAVRYAIEGKELSATDKQAIARDFEDVVTEVLLHKAELAINKYGVKTIILGGGVSANQNIRDNFADFFNREYPELTLYFPDPNLSTDNSIMIAFVGHAHAGQAVPEDQAINLRAEGNKAHRRIAPGTPLFQ